MLSAQPRIIEQILEDAMMNALTLRLSPRFHPKITLNQWWFIACASEARE